MASTGSDDPGMWIPGLGENKARPRELGGGMFGYVPDAFSNNLPTLPSESARMQQQQQQQPQCEEQQPSSVTPASSNPPSEPDETAGDSSQMRDALFRPESPEITRRPVQEEACVAVDVTDAEATPFSTPEAETKKILIRGGTLVNCDETIEKCDILVDDGVIVEIGNDLERPPEAVVVEASGKFVCPGGIDLTTFFGAEKVDDFNKGTKAALAGGTTLVNVVVKAEAKAASIKAAFDAAKSDAESSARCNFAFTVVLPRWDDAIKAEVEELAKTEGVAHFKILMSDDDEDNDQAFDKAEDILAAMEGVKAVGGIVSVHAENGLVIKENAKRLLARGIRGPEGHLMSRPEEAEEEAVVRACAYAASVNVPLVVSGCTSKAAVNAVGKATRRGQAVWAEPAALALAADGSHYFNNCWDHAAGFVASPPLRDDPETPDVLAKAVASSNSGFNIVSSRHNTFNMADKEIGKDCFAKIPKGFNGVEERMSIVFDKCNDVQRFVAVTSANAAKALNVYPKKGRLAVDSDADIVVWNINNVRQISAKTQVQSGDFNAFEGLKVDGAPEFVLSGGKIAVFEYDVKAGEGQGQFVEVGTFPPALYDLVADYSHVQNGVDREEKKIEEEIICDKASEVGSTVTSVASETATAVLNKRLGIYQRPMSAHGVRNQQDSTFSLSGGYEENRRASVKVNAPPGGQGRRLW